jgi:hypothetical protein
MDNFSEKSLSLTHKDRYVLFNNTGKNISFDINKFSEDLSIPKYKRRKLSGVNRVNVLLKNSHSVDLVEVTGLSYEELKNNIDVKNVLKNIGPLLSVDCVSFMYEFDHLKYVEVTEEAVKFTEEFFVPKEEISDIGDIFNTDLLEAFKKEELEKEAEKEERLEKALKEKEEVEQKIKKSLMAKSLKGVPNPTPKRGRPTKKKQEKLGKLKAKEELTK